MDNHHLRVIILKILDSLSNDDRRRLHFLLLNDVPRRISHDPSFSDTLSLMESRFDQDKMNEKDLIFLINIFETIQCTDAVKLLKRNDFVFNLIITIYLSRTYETNINK